MNKTDTRKSMVAVSAFCALAAAGTVLFPQLWVYLLFSVLLYAGYSVSLPILQNMVAQRADPGQKNLVMGFYNATKSLGSIAGSLLAGFLYTWHVKLPFWVVTAVFVISVPVALAYLMKTGREKRHP